MLPGKNTEGTSKSRGECKEGNAASHPGPHRGDDTRAQWPVSIEREVRIRTKKGMNRDL
jgi:hypothetical protein